MADAENDSKSPAVDPKSLTLERLQPLYVKMTIHEASKDIDVGLTALKRQCRALGVRRWPFRQLSSVKRMIEEYEHSRDVTRRVGNVELTTEQHFHSLDLCIKQLQSFYDALRLNPGYKNDAQLKEIYRMRQSMFKAAHNFKRKSSGEQAAPAPRRRRASLEQLGVGFGNAAEAPADFASSWMM